ncbi:MAG: hypothetical protein ACREQ9_09830, partial [Candidatus Binatia bacterium]
SGGRRLLEAIGFRKADWVPAAGSRIDIVFSPEINHWEGRERTQLVIRDLQASCD